MTDRLLLTNAQALTMNVEAPKAETVLIDGSLIEAVGERAQQEADNCQSIDLQGGCVLPGFIDTHCHLRGLGETLGWIECSPSKAASIDALIELLRSKSDISGWIIARGYDQDGFIEKRHPTLSDLNRVSTERPVVVIHSSGHGGTTNSLGLRAAGIEARTPNPKGGTIERNTDGSLTGRLTESALNLIWAAVPKASHDYRVQAIAGGSIYSAALGITSAVEATAEIADVAAFFDAAETGALSIRCSPWILADQLQAKGWPSPDDLVDGRQSPLVTLDTAKIFVDGAIGTRTALLRSGYTDDPGDFGTAIWDTEELVDLVEGATEAGWRLAIHAIGDAAIDRILAAYEHVDSALVQSRRNRIEHAMVLHEEQLNKMVSLGIQPVFQPEFVSRFGDMYLDAIGQRAYSVKPYRSVINAGIPLSFSSDMPVVPGNPLAGAAAAVLRSTASGKVLGEEQRITPLEALAAYTSGAAYAERAEEFRGKIKAGMNADFVVLSENPLAIPVHDWSRISVVSTIVGGRFVYDPHRISPG